MVDRLKELKVKATIITAAASQLGGMLLRVCKKEGIQTIATIRRAEQAKVVECENIVNTADKDWEK